MSETRSEIIGMCRREAHSNLQRHIRSRSSGAVRREYTLSGTSRRQQPLTTMELLLVAAITLFRVRA